MSSVLPKIAAFVLTLLAMELVATLVHRHVMHGMGWKWHRSHHAVRSTLFEVNDLYALIFTAISIALFSLGGAFQILWWIGLGMLGYGLLYTALHDALVHRRLPAPKVPRSGYVQRLVQAHRLHHAVHEREGAVTFGFLYAPPISRLVNQLKARRASR